MGIKFKGSPSTWAQVIFYIIIVEESYYNLRIFENFFASSYSAKLHVMKTSQKIALKWIKLLLLPTTCYFKIAHYGDAKTILPYFLGLTSISIIK